MRKVRKRGVEVMKVVICCPNCGKEEISLQRKNNPYIYNCDNCNTIFSVNDSGFNIYKNGEISDGSHTFDELYHHRMMLFAVICNTHTQRAWKSWKHHDGTMFNNYFIVGVNTPEGQYSYHYHEDNWDYFDVKELEFAPEWDGHQPKDINRLLSLL